MRLESPAIAAESLLCVACGLVWLSADPKQVEEKLSKYGTDELKSRLGLKEKAPQDLGEWGCHRTHPTPPTTA
jgi:hypothetical protein